jgi:hypothetical protein
MSCDLNSVQAMRVNYSDEPVCYNPKSIFLAGPTPRKKHIPSWRPEAVRILTALGFDGVVYVPERQNWSDGYDYDTQIEWEWSALECCGCVVFWVPRQLPDMPAFTTNVEFGMAVGWEKMLYGRPVWAEKTGYLDKLYRKKRDLEPLSSLQGLLAAAYWTTKERNGTLASC